MLAPLVGSSLHCNDQNWNNLCVSRLKKAHSHTKSINHQHQHENITFFCIHRHDIFKHVYDPTQKTSSHQLFYGEGLEIPTLQRKQLSQGDHGNGGIQKPLPPMGYFMPETAKKTMCFQIRNWQFTPLIVLLLLHLLHLLALDQVFFVCI